jgi:hypothetical protein
MHAEFEFENLSGRYLTTDLGVERITASEWFLNK